MKIKALVTAALLAACISGGCTSKNSPGWVGFVINQDAKSAGGNAPGKSYTSSPASLSPTGATALRLEGGGSNTDIQFTLEIPVSKPVKDEILTKTLTVPSGKLRMPDQTLELEQGSFTLQTLEAGVARGNFNARVKNHNPPWEIVGSFEAPCGIP